MAAFGLRLEEALKLKPVQADKGHVLRLQGSWTKGGRTREIPIRDDRQRALLAQGARTRRPKLHDPDRQELHSTP